MFPADFKLPMVAPEDLGVEVARLLTEPAENTQLLHVEGPERYSPADVATAFATALGNPVRAEVVPREQWEQVFKSFGFSAAAAESYARMTAVTLDEQYERVTDPARGKTSLTAYIARLVGATAL